MSANYFMTATVALFLKLTSFHHVLYDNRSLIKRLERMKKEEDSDKDWASRFDIHPETFKIASEYPRNLTLKHYIRYLVAPTFCYQHSYPSTGSISVVFLIKRIVEVTICNVGMAFLLY